jgi:ABC-2 type transport system permease protein
MSLPGSRPLGLYARATLLTTVRDKHMLVWSSAFPLVLAGILRLYDYKPSKPLPLGAAHSYDLVAPALIATVAMTFGLIGGALVLSQQRESGLFAHLRALRLSPRTYSCAFTLGRLPVAAAQQLAVLLATTLVFGARIHDAETAIPLIVAFGVIGFILFSMLGVIVSQIAASPNGAQSLGQALAYPMLLLCGVILPITALPAFARSVALRLPLAPLVQALQELALHKHVEHAFTADAPVLAAWTAAITAAALIVSRFEVSR